EINYRHHQTLQARRCARGPRRGRDLRDNRHRGQGLRSPEGAHGALPRRRIRRGLPAQDQAGDRRGRFPGGQGHRGHYRRRAYRQDRGRQDLRLRSRPGHPHPHRRDRSGRPL
ncbi:MAG: Nitrogen regulatory protein P-II, partial [Olavius algarvensis Gamma 1 endosymbiont]